MPTSAFKTTDPRLQPAYTVAEAAQYLRMPSATLRSWVAGRSYPIAAGGTGHFEPLIRLDDPNKQYLSFINLVEAHVLAAMRRRHGVKLPKVRRALNYVQRQFHKERPLIDESFQTNGLDLFIERYGQMINASREGQEAMREVMKAYLQRIDRDAKGLPVKLYPFTRRTDTPLVAKDNPRDVVIDPAVSYGQPVISGTGIPVNAIYERYRAGDSMKQLAKDFRLKDSAIEEAIRCEAA